MIEGCGGPSDSGVALAAVGGKVGGHVIRVGRLLIILQVAANAGGGGQVVVVGSVAVGALARRHGVRVGQRKSHQVVIEFRIQPGIGGVAILACDGKHSRDVVRSSRILKVGLMAGITIGRHRAEVAVSSVLVASVAIDGGMGSGQREAIVVVLNIANRDLPSAHRVALLAVRAELAAVNVGVAILAALSDVGEYRFHVALGTGHRLVHAAQGILRAIVIEFRNGPNWAPGVGSMAILARDAQVSVRTAGHFRLLLLRVSADGRHCQKYDD